jgi:hypothetical protein
VRTPYPKNKTKLKTKVCDVTEKIIGFTVKRLAQNEGLDVDHIPKQLLYYNPKEVKECSS